MTIAFGSSGASPGDVLVINSSGIAEFEPLLFNENSGSATFDASGSLNIVGTGAISTSGTGNTVTIAFGSSGSSPGEVLTINSSGIAVFEPLVFNENSGSATFNASGALSIVGGTGVSTVGTGAQVTINAIGGGITWVDATSNVTPMAINTGYFSDSGSILDFTLPSSTPFGAVFRIVGGATGGWSIPLTNGQTIQYGASTATTALASMASTDAVELVCIVAGATATLAVLSCQGGLDVS